MAIVACPALAWSGVARNRRARKAESARSAAERGQSDKPKKAEAGGGAPAEWETRALRALKSDLAPYVLPWLVVGAVLLFLLGDVTADIAVPMALFLPALRSPGRGSRGTGEHGNPRAPTKDAPRPGHPQSQAMHPATVVADIWYDWLVCFWPVRVRPVVCGCVGHQHESRTGVAVVDGSLFATGVCMGICWVG